MSQNKNGIIYTVIAWTVIIAIAAGAWFFFFAPKQNEKILSSTGSEQRFREEVVCQLDSFSGYALLRHPKLHESLAKHGVKWTPKDDQANYTQRLKDLENGNCDLAVFTVDAYLKTAIQANSFPGSIIMIIDESNGADGIVTKDPNLTSIDQLNKSNFKFVLTPDSPSEFLSRALVNSFHLPLLGEELPFIAANGSEEVLTQLKNGAHQNKAFILWEPQLSTAIDSGAKVLMDSSKTRGMIVDVLLANRNFLQNKEHLLKKIISEYLSLRFAISQAHQWQDMVKQDATLTNTKLNDSQANRIVEGIQWKNTMDNYLHFGIENNSHGHHIEDIINRIWKVLAQTKAWGDQTPDELNIPANHLYYSKIWAELKSENYRPSFSNQQLDSAQQVKQLPKKSDAEWQGMKKVGQLQVEPIQFARGASRLTLGGERNLKELSKLLISWPHYYVEIRGNTRNQGDLDANRALAKARAATVHDYLINLGASSHRLRQTQSQMKGNVGQSVEFSFFEAQY